MPRRTGRDRYKPKQVPPMTDLERRLLLMAWVAQNEIYSSTASSPAPSTIVLACTHGVEWRSCTVCSKPVRR